MTFRLCHIDGCSKPVNSRGLCPMHYQRWRKWGDPFYVPPAPTLQERFWAKVEKSPSCWVWTAAKDRRGYGWVRQSGRNHAAHRVAYTWLKGPIPEGLEIDHLCRNPSCVNPDHLEPVTHLENVHRGIGNGWQLNAAKTHCPQGHPYDEENTERDKKGRRCRTCRRARASRKWTRGRRHQIPA